MKNCAHRLYGLCLNAEAYVLCAEHVRQLGGESPLSNLVEVKD